MPSSASGGSDAAAVFAAALAPKVLTIGADGRAHGGCKDLGAAVGALGGAPVALCDKSLLSVAAGGAVQFARVGDVACALTGTLDNREYLHKRLSEEGEGQETANDAELVAALWCKFHETLCVKLWGAWSFVLIDLAAGRTFAARAASPAAEALFLMRTAAEGVVLVASAAAAPLLTAEMAERVELPRGFYALGHRRATVPVQFAHSKEELQAVAAASQSAVLRALSGLGSATKRPAAPTASAAAPVTPESARRKRVTTPPKRGETAQADASPNGVQRPQPPTPWRRSTVTFNMELHAARVAPAAARVAVKPAVAPQPAPQPAPAPRVEAAAPAALPAPALKPMPALVPAHLRKWSSDADALAAYQMFASTVVTEVVSALVKVASEHSLATLVSDRAARQSMPRSMSSTQLSAAGGVRRSSTSSAGMTRTASCSQLAHIGEGAVAMGNMIH